jgi:hypothetical protein
MPEASNPARRVLMERLVMGLSCGLLMRARRAEAFEFPGPAAASAPLLGVKDPAAVAVHYVEDARQAREAKPGSTCANCSAYTGKTGADAGPCALFPDKVVKAAGWCNAWSNL